MNPRALRIIPLLALLLLPSACKRPEMAEERAVLSVRIAEAPATRAEPAHWDCDGINSLSVFVFRADGTLENSGRSSGSSLRLALPKGREKRLYVLANAPAAADACTTEAQLRALDTRLSDQRSGAFAMAWSGRIDVDGDTSVAVELPRIVAQVRIDRISNLSSHALTLHSLYLTNVPVAAAPWLSPDSYEPAAWAHPMGYAASEWEGWLRDDLGGRILAPGESLEETHVFYSLPNPMAEDRNGGSWSPRRTRLVLEAEMEGVRYYYPFTFSQLRANHRYRLAQLGITRPGSRHPDQPVDPREARFTVSLLSWSGAEVSYTDPL